MFCPNCGKDNNGNKFCSNCGTMISNASKRNDYMVISLVLGIVCLIMSFIFNILCLIPGIISIVFAIKYKKESGKLGVGFGLSLGGIIFSIVVFLFILFSMLFVINSVKEVSSDYYDDRLYIDDYYEYY